MTRMTGPDCVVMCNLINMYITYIHTYIHAYIYILIISHLSQKWINSQTRTGQRNINFPCSADHEQDWQPYPVDPYSAIYVMTIPSSNKTMPVKHIEKLSTTFFCSPAYQFDLEQRIDTDSDPTQDAQPNFKSRKGNTLQRHVYARLRRDRSVFPCFLSILCNIKEKNPNE